MTVEEDGSGKTDRREECAGAAVIAHGDPSPILQSGKYVLDLVALSEPRLVVVDWLFAILGRRNTRLDPAFVQGGAEMIAVVAMVAVKVLAAGSSSISRSAPVWSLIPR
jgi:hypothetical protein